MKYVQFILIILLILSPSCTQVYFEEPQPPGKKNLSSIPGKIQGLYFSNSGDSILRINKDFIITYLDNGRNLKFSLSDNMILRKSKGIYYINIRNREKPYWMLFLLSYYKGVLYPEYSILNDKNLQKYNKITDIFDSTNNSNLDKNEYLLNPGRKELKELIKADFFEIMDTLTRIK